MQIRSLGYKELILLVLLVLLIVQCSERNSENTFSVQKAGELLFRRSYGIIQFRQMSDKQLDSIEKSNPEFYNGFEKADSVFIEKLKIENIVDENYSLVREKFNNNNVKQFTLIADNGEKVHCEIKRPADSIRYDEYDLIITRGKLKDLTEIEGHYGMLNEDIKYLLLDLIPGGYKEIVILNEYYIMNGDNSDIYIYEIQ